jgi:C-terminal processing protease CtpA/Prc
LALAGCGSLDDDNGLASPNPNPDPCTAGQQVQFVAERMEDQYFWNDEPDQSAKYVNLDTGAFATPDDLLDVLRYRPDEFDRFFTHITTIDEDEQLFGAGQFVGFGFSFDLDDATAALWITQVFAGSPAEAAGLARGLRILEIDGRTIAEIEAAEGIEAAFGASEIGVMRQFVLQMPGAATFVTTATKDLVTIDPVPQHRVFDVGGRTVGYFEFRTFVGTAPAELQSVFGEFAAAGVTDVIVDVRYNGGGLVNVADYFASLLAGPSRVGHIMSFTRFNSANSALNSQTVFSAVTNSIDLDSIVFITTEGSASATELVINALEPYLDVKLVGARTFGKPVGQSGRDFCGRRLRLVTFEVVNVNNEGGFFAGLPVDCAADDELSFATGDPAEDSLAAALTLVATGACPVAAGRDSPMLRSVAAPRAPGIRRSDSVAREFAYAY